MIQLFKKYFTHDLHLRELLKGGGIAIAFKGVGIGAGYVFFFAIARIFGPQQLGVFSTCWTIMMICAVVGKFGIDTSIVKFISESLALDKIKITKNIHRNSLFIVLASSFVVGAIVYLFSGSLSMLFFEDKGHVMLVKMIAVMIIPFSLMRLNAETMRGMKDITRYSVYENGTIYFLALIFILFLYYVLGYTDIIIPAMLAAVVVLFIASYLMVRRALPGQLAPGRNVYNFRKILKVSFPMLFSNSLFLVMSWTDILMLSAYLDEASVGIYNTALKIAALNTVALVAINTIAAPKISGLHASNNQIAFRSVIKQTSLLSTVIALPVLLAIFIMPEFLLTIFGESFLNGKNALMILASGFFFSAFSGSTIYILNMTGKEKIARNILIIASILNLAMNLYLIPLLGLNGAAISTTVCTVIWNLLAVIYIYRDQGFLTYPVKMR